MPFSPVPRRVYQQGPAGALTSPSQHRGFIGKADDPESATAQEVFQEVSILLDSGSQQEQLCSTVITQSLGAKGLIAGSLGPSIVSLNTNKSSSSSSALLVVVV